mmetsp:Transcript_11112/g.37831  ORF Transcript_11112/g.37831 Transcript_11112/m.37831 type:complete len:267 (+) Transcript_11112:470-1270(+)
MPRYVRISVPANYVGCRREGRPLFRARRLPGNRVAPVSAPGGRDLAGKPAGPPGGQPVAPSQPTNGVAARGRFPFGRQRCGPNQQERGREPGCPGLTLTLAGRLAGHGGRGAQAAARGHRPADPRRPLPERQEGGAGRGHHLERPRRPAAGRRRGRPLWTRPFAAPEQAAREGGSAGAAALRRARRGKTFAGATMPRLIPPAGPAARSWRALRRPPRARDGPLTRGIHAPYGAALHPRCPPPLARGNSPATQPSGSSRSNPSDRNR